MMDLRLPVLLGVFLVWASIATAMEAGHGWRADLDGPTKRCKVPQHILFVEGDAIISGKINFGGVTYYAKGRIEIAGGMETSLSLIRFHDDKKPLVTINAIADGTWNGTWTARNAGCSGEARIANR